VSLPLSQDIRYYARSAWDRMQKHRFVTEIEHDRLAPEVFKRYLVYEHAFVETAISIFAYALARASTPSQRQTLVIILRALVEDQIDYFNRAFAHFAIDPGEELRRHRPAGLLMFKNGMLGIAASGTYAEIMVTMLAAEWMYMTWSERVLRRPSRDAWIREWVSLHTEQPFVEQVNWLQGQVDDAGKTLTATERNHLAEVFLTALELEIIFHDAPYVCLPTA
jgi:thiaminase (transcriptional activator TenA)